MEPTFQAPPAPADDPVIPFGDALKRIVPMGRDRGLGRQISHKGQVPWWHFRALYVQRLVDTTKAVMRRANNGAGYGFYCEQCQKWVQDAYVKVNAETPPPATWANIRICPRCNSAYAVEMVIYSRVVEEGDDD